MSQYRPPLGGLFRLQAPQPQARTEKPSEAQSEARDAIRHFVSVLERLDREANRPPSRTKSRQALPKPASPRPSASRPKREKVR